MAEKKASSAREGLGSEEREELAYWIGERTAGIVEAEWKTTRVAASRGQVVGSGPVPLAWVFSVSNKQKAHLR